MDFYKILNTLDSILESIEPQAQDEQYVACIVDYNRSGQAMVRRSVPVSKERAEEIIANARAKNTFKHPPYMTVYPASAGRLDGEEIMSKFPDMSREPQNETSMAGAEKHKTGPKFTGYWKGTDAGTPGNKMVGSSESIEEEIARDWNSYLAEFGANPATGTAAGGQGQPSTVDIQKKAKEISLTQQNLNKLKSAGVNLPTGVSQAAKSAVTTADDPKANPMGLGMDQNAKKTAMSLGQEVEKLMTTGNPGQVQQVANAIKQAKLGNQ